MAAFAVSEIIAAKGALVVVAGTAALGLRSALVHSRRWQRDLLTAWRAGADGMTGTATYLGGTMAGMAETEAGRAIARYRRTRETAWRVASGTRISGLRRVALETGRMSIIARGHRLICALCAVA